MSKRERIPEIVRRLLLVTVVPLFLSRLVKERGVRPQKGSGVDSRTTLKEGTPTVVPPGVFTGTGLGTLNTCATQCTDPLLSIPSLLSMIDERNSTPTRTCSTHPGFIGVPRSSLFFPLLSPSLGLLDPELVSSRHSVPCVHRPFPSVRKRDSRDEGGTKVGPPTSKT